ncbi:peptidoglycan binding domain-containing protein, partial [Aeromicrobium sp.]|uniref:peptidoglycan binding domain-containing protein n=1 Tax=Aeromicrobium sp. TaxID=1871063 RepID=UPI0019A609D1
MTDKPDDELNISAADDVVDESGVVEEGDELDLGDGEDGDEKVADVDDGEQVDDVEAPEPVADDEPRGFPDDEPHDAVRDEDEPYDAAQASNPRHWGRRVALGLAAVVAALYVGGYFLTGIRMPANATIAGVEVSGKSPADARAAVDKALTPRISREIVLTHGKKEFRIKPDDAGLALDLDRTIDEAGGARSWKPADVLGLFVGRHRTDPALDVDYSALRSAIDTIGESVNTEVVEAQITFPDGKPEIRNPRSGLVVAGDDAASAIRNAYLVSDKPVEVPTAVVEPAVDSDAVAAVKKSFADPAVSGPVTLAVGDKEVSLPVSAYAPALVVRVKDYQLQPFIDAKKLAKPLTDSTTGIGKKAVDATVRIENDKPV